MQRDASETERKRLTVIDQDQPEPLYHLRMLSDVETEQGRLHKEKRVKLDPHLAIDLILEGDAEFWPVQTSPPFQFLDRIEEQLMALHTLVGPPYASPTLLKRFEEEVLAGGRRRASVASKQLVWWQGTKNAAAAFNQLFDFSALDVNAALHIAGSVWTSRKSKVGSELSGRALSVEEMIKEGVFCEPIQKRRSRSMFHAEDRYALKYRRVPVGPDWMRFYQKLETLRQLPVQQFEKSLSQGRILAVSEGQGGCALISPTSWREGAVARSVQAYGFFLFTGDLPKNWAERKSKRLTGEEREAAVEEVASWIASKYKELHPKGIRWLKGECIAEAQKHFADRSELSDRIFLDAWKRPDIPNWRVSGPRKGTRHKKRPR